MTFVKVYFSGFAEISSMKERIKMYEDAIKEWNRAEMDMINKSFRLKIVTEIMLLVIMSLALMFLTLAP